jgi:hypothetical protein
MLFLPLCDFTRVPNEFSCFLTPRRFPREISCMFAYIFSSYEASICDFMLCMPL